MVDLNAIIALAPLMYALEKNVHELHPIDEKSFNDFINK